MDVIQDVLHVHPVLGVLDAVVAMVDAGAVEDVTTGALAVKVVPDVVVVMEPVVAVPGVETDAPDATVIAQGVPVALDRVNFHAVVDVYPMQPMDGNN